MADARQKSRHELVWLRMPSGFHQRKKLLCKSLNNESVKKRIIKAIIWSVALYAAETWI